MASITRRYFYKGPWPEDLKNATDPALTLPAPKFAIAYDVFFDDMTCSMAAVDERMSHCGCFPDVLNTIVLSPEPFIGIISPDNSIWKLSIDNLGILLPIKVS